MRDHHLVGQVDAPATSDLRVSIQAETTARTLPHRTNSPAEIMVVTLGLHTVDQVEAAMNTQDHRLVDQADDVATLPHRTNSPAEIMVVTLGLHTVDQVEAAMNTQDHRLVDQADDVATLPHRTNSPAEIMVVTSGLHTVDQVVAAMNTQDHRLADQAADVANLPRHRADLVADGVHKLDGCLMGLMGNPEDDLAISDLLANEVAEIVVQTLGHHPADPVVYEVIMTVHPDVDRMVMIAANQVVIATRDPSDHLDETHKGRIY